MEVPCSGVPLGSLARFEMAVGSGRSALGSEIEKHLTRDGRIGESLIST